MLIRRYKAVVVNGRLLLTLFVLFAILVRVLFYLSPQFSPVPHTAIGYLAEPISSFFDGNKLWSVLVASLSIVSIAAISSLINSRYTLIRTKTYLPIIFSVLLFSFHFQSFTMNIQYISAITILLAISSLFAAYENRSKQHVAFSASFTIALGSLFDISLLAYLPLIWFILPVLRSFSFKAILASLCSVALLYFPIFSYCLLTDKVDQFYAPFLQVTSERLSHLPFTGLQLTGWIILGLSILLFIVIFVDNYVTSFRDKIKTRSYNTVLAIVIAFSLLAYLFLNTNPLTYKYVGLAVSTLILGHFFAVAEEKWKIITFVFYMILYFIFCFINLQAVF